MPPLTLARATAATTRAAAASPPAQALRINPLWSQARRASSAKRPPAGRGRAAPRASASDVADPATPTPTPTPAHTPSPVPFTGLVCPVCLTTPLGPPAGLVHTGRGTLKPLRCGRCARTFDAAPEFLDLTPASGVSSASSSSNPLGTSLFQSPLVAFAYDRGWRAGFAWAGFPGPDAEADAALAFLAPAHGRVLVDLSCGSGLFTRRFAASGKFSGIVAADFSEAMLREAVSGLAADGVDPGSYLPLRLDAGRLPFGTGTVAGVHAGAALHCWPAPGLAVAEISRVLRPGGVFVGSTFLDAAAPLGSVIGDEAASSLAALIPGAVGGSMPGGRAFRWWSEAEVRALCAAAGLVGFKRWRRNRFIMWAAVKPEPDPGV
jgi:SAM-dependent methyltransferase